MTNEPPKTGNADIDPAVELAWKHAQIDGAHHKLWVIDQMLRRMLTGRYEEFVKAYEASGEYEWNTGIAP